VACAQGHIEVAVALLAAGAAPSRGALLDACRARQAAVVDALVEAGASLPSVQPRLGRCEEVVGLLCSAAHANDLPGLAMLLKAGADAGGSDYDRRTALHIAAADGHLRGVQLLVELGGASPAVQDRWVLAV
jgi:ankyrin repeat protein